MAADAHALIPALKDIAIRLRIDSIRATTAAGSGHPTSCCSAADIVAALFFAEMRFDPRQPQNRDNDRFVMSKGHAAPLLYAAWAEAGAFDRSELLKLREIGSDLEGHPTPRLPFVDVATGSLGQGLALANGMALALRLDGNTEPTVFALLGDGEIQEGEVWEAAMLAAHYHLSNIVAIVDLNGLQIDGPTAEVMDVGDVEAKFAAFGWHVVTCDGHDLEQLASTHESVSAGTAGVLGGESDVLLGGERGDEVEALEDEANCRATQAHKRLTAQLVDSLAAHPDLAGVGRVEASGDVHEGRLAGPRRPHDRSHLAAHDIESRRTKCVDIVALAKFVALRELDGVDDGLVLHGGLTHSATPPPD